MTPGCPVIQDRLLILREDAMKRISAVAFLLFYVLLLETSGQTATGTPTLLSPATGTVNMPDSVLLSWASVPGAAGYIVAVATNTAFSPLFSEQGPNPQTSLEVGGFAGGTTYFWMVSSTGYNETSAWSSIWSFSTIGPQTPVPLYPSNGNSNVFIASFLLRWDPDTGNGVTYGVQVGYDSNFTESAYSTTGLTSPWQGLTGGANNYKYYWHVNASAEGMTSAWSAGWSFTTNGSTGSYLPANGTTNQPVSTTLSWAELNAAASYAVQLSTGSNFSNNYQVTLDSNSLALPVLNYSTIYYWRVGSVSGGVTTWSSVQQFTTIVAAPGPPVLSSPTNSAINQALALTLGWATDSLAASYAVQVSTTTTFASTVLNQSGITATACPLNWLANSTVYYWHTNATNAGGTGVWSAVWNFTTAAPVVPAAPVLTAPTNGSTQMVIPNALSWGRVLGATTYTAEVASSSNFSTTVFRTTGPGLSAAASNLDTDKTYFWQVNAGNTAGTGAWSGIWSFRTISGIPAVPVLLSGPGLTQPDTFTWKAAAGASSYTWQISNDYYFSTTLVNQSGITGTDLTLASYFESGYWEVNASNVYGTSAWSSVGSFSFAECKARKAVAQVASPANTGIINYVQLPVTISWTWGPGCGGDEPPGYSLEIATDSSFSAPVVNTSALSVTAVYQGDEGDAYVFSYTTDSLRNSTTYYWRIRQGGGPWGSISQFTTVIASPVLSLPSNNAQNQNLSVSLSWNSVSGAAIYHVQLSTASNFSGTVFTSNSQAGSVYTASPLANNTLYYWRAADSGTGAWSAWSSAWSFTVNVTRAEEIAQALRQSGIYMRNNILYYRLAVPDLAEISLYDIIGKKTVLLNRSLPAGTYSLSLRNAGLAHGLYVLHFKAGILDRRLKFVMGQ